MRQHGDEADVAFPAAETLVQRRLADDFLPVQHQQGQVPLEIRVPAPVLEHLAVENRLLDEQTLLLGHGEEKFVQAGVVPFAQRTDHAFRAVTQFHRDRKFFQCVFEHHNEPFVSAHF